MNFSQFLSTWIWGNSVEHILQFFAVLCGSVIAAYVIKKFLNIIFLPIVSRTEAKWDNFLLAAVESALSMAGWVVGLMWGMEFVREYSTLGKVLGQVLLLLIALLITLVVLRTAMMLIDHSLRKNKQMLKQVGPLARWIASFVIWAIAVAITLSKLGFNVTSLLAGLGIGGVAVALAVQPILANLFGSISILTDKPFSVGDTVKLAGYEGVVSEIGIRTTRITTITGTELIVPNTQMVSSILENVSARDYVRVDLSIGVEYSVSETLLERGMSIIRSLLEQEEMVKKEDIRVLFSEFGDSALTIKVMYWIDAKLTAIEQQALQSSINLKIKQQFEREKIGFAFPTMTVYTKS